MTLHHLPARPALRIVETSSSGLHGYAEPVADRDRIEITAGLTKVFAVRIDGVIYAEFATASNALRCRAAMVEFANLGVLDLIAPEPPRAA